MGWLFGRRARVKSAQELLDEYHDSLPQSSQGSTATTAGAEALGAFELPVEDVFNITGRGTVATGVVVRGSVRVGDRVTIVRGVEEWPAVVNGVEAFRRKLDVAQAGDQVGLVFRAKTRLERGDVIRQG